MSRMQLGAQAGPPGPPGPPGHGADVKSGIVNLRANATVAVSFVTPFAATPQVMTMPHLGVSCYEITKTGFTMTGISNDAGQVSWIATDAGNP